MSDFTKTIVGAISGFIFVAILDKIITSSKTPKAVVPAVTVSGARR